MRIITTTTICLMMVFASFAQSLKVDTENTTVSYNFVKEKVTGTVSGFEATLDLNFEDISKSKISGSVDATTLTSGNGMRDKHLQAKDYFNTKEFPKMSFESTGFEKTDKGYSVTGKMTIRNISQEVNITFIKEDNVINGKCIIYTNDFEIASKKKRDDSKVLIKFKVAVK
jgi:polyisoprenoid-binding protein YceI